MQQEVLDDNTAGSKANPLEVSGVTVAGSSLVDCPAGYVKASRCLMECSSVDTLCLSSISQHPNTVVAAS